MYAAAREKVSAARRARKCEAAADRRENTWRAPGRWRNGREAVASTDANETKINASLRHPIGAPQARVLATAALSTCVGARAATHARIHQFETGFTLCEVNKETVAVGS
jgi:hypothetical protein